MIGRIFKLGDKKDIAPGCYQFTDEVKVVNRKGEKKTISVLKFGFEKQRNKKQVTHLTKLWDKSVCGAVQPQNPRAFAFATEKTGDVTCPHCLIRMIKLGGKENFVFKIMGRLVYGKRN